MKTIAFILPYYGTYPNYFNLWLETAGYNSTIDFFIITDIASDLDFPPNVYVINMSFEALTKRIQTMFDFNICLAKPYKLCDYRPLYGLLFDDIIKNYDFWGYCDFDVILGNLRKFITDEMLNQYEKIYTRGHLSLYKNILWINQLCLEHHVFNTYTYKEAFTTNYACHFDEWGGISKIWQLKGLRFYDEIDFADTRINIFHFELAEPMKKDHKLKAFYWNKGKLFGYVYDGSRISKKEYAYLHLQKRTMTAAFRDVPEAFAIVPNQFIRYSKEDITKDFVLEHCRKKIIYTDYLKKRAQNIIGNIKDGALLQRYCRWKKRLSNSITK